jgi:hypothetical protein
MLVVVEGAISPFVPTLGLDSCPLQQALRSVLDIKPEWG